MHRSTDSLVVRFATGFLLFSLAVILGCERPNRESKSRVSDATAANESLTDVAPIREFSDLQQQQRQVATAAKDDLFMKLSGRLMSVIGEAGPASAIDVCKSEAPKFSWQVSQKFGVEIGRTAFKLRNSTNQPPAWAKQFVANRVDTPTFVALPEGSLGAMLPIHLKPACTICHGTKEQIAPDVKSALALHYPIDAATGFREGDLRGWFWVEVPADAVNPSD